MAYTPGVAEPVREIFRNSENSYKYTNRGNLVAVISNGTEIFRNSENSYKYTNRGNLVAVISNGTAILGLAVGQ